MPSWLDHQLWASSAYTDHEDSPPKTFWEGYRAGQAVATAPCLASGNMDSPDSSQPSWGIDEVHVGTDDKTPQSILDACDANSSHNHSNDWAG